VAHLERWAKEMKVPSRTHGLLSSEEQKLLRSLIGQDVFIAFSPWIDAAFHRFDCGALSLSLRPSPGFLVIDTVWEEDEALEDFGWLTVCTAERARGVPYSKEGHPFNASSISLTPASPISQITLFRKKPSPDWEFDHALLFEHEERFRYVVSYEPGAFQRLVVSFSERAIDDVTRDLPAEPV
jgi:hypothetical protein